MNSPVAFRTSVDARNSSASRFVRKPRLSVCEWSVLRYRTRKRFPAAVAYAVIDPTGTPYAGRPVAGTAPRRQPRQPRQSDLVHHHRAGRSGCGRTHRECERSRSTGSSSFRGERFDRRTEAGLAPGARGAEIFKRSSRNGVPICCTVRRRTDHAGASALANPNE